MQKFKGVVLRQFDSVGTGNVESGAEIQVLNQADDSVATIYSDNGVTEKANPFRSSSLGEYEFFAANGLYKILIGNPVQKTEENVSLFDSADFSGFPEAPNDGEVYARDGLNEQWVEATEEAPDDGLPYVRRNGVWVAGNSVSGGGYPAKVGDIYESSSGAIDASRDLELNGQTVSGTDYPDLAGLPGYVVQNDPSDVDSAQKTTPVTVALSSSRPVSSCFINKSKTRAFYARPLASNIVEYSDTTDENIDGLFSVIEDFRWAKYCGDNNMLISAENNSSVDVSCSVVGIYDTALNSFTSFGRTINTRLAMCASDDGQTIAIGEAGLGVFAFSIDGGSNFTSGAISGSTQVVRQIEQFGDTFYFLCGNLSNFGQRIQVLEIYSTTDFVNFTDLTANIPNGTATQAHSSGGSLFYIGTGANGANNFVTTDFITYNSSVLDVSISSPIATPITGTDAVCANSSERMTFDQGLTVEQFSNATFNGGTVTGFFNGTNIILASTNGVNANVYKYDAIVSVGGLITVPNATSDVSGAKYYVRAK